MSSIGEDTNTALRIAIAVYISKRRPIAIGDVESDSDTTAPPVTA